MISWDQKTSPFAMVPTPTRMTPICDRSDCDTDAISIEGPSSSKDSSPLGTLGTLPPELIYQILDFMHPHEYSGLPCTCRCALSLVNRKLKVREYKSWKSAAAPYVNMQSITLAPLNFVYGSKDVSFNYSVGPDFDDPDL
jgi:hypothetical protein